MASLKHPFTARLIQYVHDAGSQERLNVGITLDCPALTFVGCRFASRLERISSAFPGADVVALKRVLAALRARLEALSGSSAGILTSMLSGSFDSGVLMGDEIRGVTSDPESTLETLFARFDLSSRKEAQPGRSEDEVWKDFTTLLGSRVVPIRKQEVSGLLPWTFKHVWQNGHLNAIEVVSLDRADPLDIKKRAAERVGIYRTLATSTAGLQISLLVGEPHDDGPRSAAARDGVAILQIQLEGLVEVVPEAKAPELASRLLSEAHEFAD